MCCKYIRFYFVVMYIDKIIMKVGKMQNEVNAPSNCQIAPHYNILSTHTNSPRAQRPLQFLHTQSSRFIKKDEAECDDVNEHAKAFQPILQCYQLFSSRSKTEKVLQIERNDDKSSKQTPKVLRSKSINPPSQKALKLKSRSIIVEKESLEAGSRNCTIHSRSSMATLKVELL